MKDTCSRQIYNYLVEFNSPLNVRVMKNNDVVIEGNATKTTAFSGFSIGNNTYLLDADNIYILFMQIFQNSLYLVRLELAMCRVVQRRRKEKQRNPIRKERQEQEQENIIKYFIKYFIK